MEGKCPPLTEGDPFLGGLTVGEYFALPDEERERIWNEEHTYGDRGLRRVRC
ncbi:MAG: hypothetical protein ACE5I2_05765 [Anaerolineae bacterium]